MLSFRLLTNPVNAQSQRICLASYSSLDTLLELRDSGHLVGTSRQILFGLTTLEMEVSIAHPQSQSTLFGILSGELRTMIYHYTFFEADQLLHIVQDIPEEDMDRMLSATSEKTSNRDSRVGTSHWSHRFCEDDEMRYSTWQHMCFGQWSKDHVNIPSYWDYGMIRKGADGFHRTSSKDWLLGLVMSCRRV